MRHIILIGALLISLAATSANITTSNTLKVWAEIPDIIADGCTINYIKFYQQDDNERDYTSFNMDLVLPKGFSLNSVRDDHGINNDIEISPERGGTHDIECNMLYDTHLRVIGYSTVNTTLVQSDKNDNPLYHLFTVGVIANPSLIEGEYEMVITGVKFVHPSGTATKPEKDLTAFQFKISNPNTKIHEINLEDLDPNLEYYDIQGFQIDPSKRRGTIVITNGNKILVK